MVRVDVDQRTLSSSSLVSTTAVQFQRFCGIGHRRNFSPVARGQGAHGADQVSGARGVVGFGMRQAFRSSLYQMSVWRTVQCTPRSDQLSATYRDVFGVCFPSRELAAIKSNPPGGWPRLRILIVTGRSCPWSRFNRVGILGAIIRDSPYRRRLSDVTLNIMNIWFMRGLQPRAKRSTSAQNALQVDSVSLSLRLGWGGSNAVCGHRTVSQ
jgi:hypothetical protein